MPSSIKDLHRLVNGVSLVAKEYLNRTQPESLIYSSLKRATDLVGFTRGRVHDQVPPRPPRSKETVVYFTQQQETPAASDVNDGGAGASNVGGGEHERERIHNEKIEEIVCNPVTETSTASTTTAEVTAASMTETSTAATATTEVTAASVTETSTAATAMAGVTAASTKIPVEEEEEDRKLENVTNETVGIAVPLKRRRPRERKVPATPFTRALGFAGLGAGLAWGTLQESTKRLVYGTPKSQENQSALSPFLSEQNAERLALALCRMRGAALKLGQMLSIQDESLVPAPILAALDIVRQGADVMPKSQLNQVLDAELGTNWTSKLRSFDYEPVAAASIGQVHRAVTKDGVEVAMKIQYPGVADSIGSDIDNVKLLLDYTNLIPKGLYLDSAIKVAKEELSRECNYEIEAANQKRFRELLSDREGIYVPRVIDDICSKRVITTEFVSGVPIDKVSLLGQKTRDYVGTKLLELTLMELFVLRFMQTDPNWSNFLYDEATNMINLIDFGAARDFPKTFVDDYLRMVMACANCDRDAVLEMSRRLGFLTGMESEIMLETHVQAGFVVGVPFSRPGGYDFRTSHITQSVSNLGATMLKHRLTPPPDEAYSLHRKLSGAFLACMKIGAVVPCRDLLLEVYQKYQFDDNGGTKVHSSDSSSNSDSI